MPEHPSILLLHGNDEQAIAAHIARLSDGLGDRSTTEMNFARFDGRSGLDFQALNTAVNAAPFLAAHRLVVLDHPASAGSFPETRKKILVLLEKAPPTTLIALVEYDELKPDKNKRPHWLLKWAASQPPAGDVDQPAGTGAHQPGARAAVHLYNLPSRWEMPRWIESEAKKQGGRIEPAAAARLAEMVGENTRFASQELSKLLAYANYDRPIRLPDVEQVSLVSAPASIFMLVDALGRKDGQTAQAVLHRMLEEEDAFALWGMVIRQFRLLLQVREMLDERLPVLDIQRALGVPDFVARKLCDQAGHFPISALETIYHKLLEIDEAAKTSQVPLDLSLDLLIVELMQGR